MASKVMVVNYRHFYCKTHVSGENPSTNISRCERAPASAAAYFTFDAGVSL